MAFKFKKVHLFGVLGLLIMLALCGTSENAKIMVARMGYEKVIFRLSQVQLF